MEAPRVARKVVESNVAEKDEANNGITSNNESMPSTLAACERGTRCSPFVCVAYGISSKGEKAWRSEGVQGIDIDSNTKHFVAARKA